MAFEAFTADGDLLTLPISVPFDEDGVVVLSSAPPKPDAPRVPAELELLRGSPPTRYRFGLALARADRRPLLVPGITAPDDPDLLPLTLLTFAVADGTGRSGHAGRTGRSGHAGRTGRSGHAGRTGRSGHAGRGMAVAGYDSDGQLADLDVDETTARALAVALLITIGVKLTKAGYAG
jgi:hypothetical protein